jgi:hypothetical protein
VCSLPPSHRCVLIAWREAERTSIWLTNKEGFYVQIASWKENEHWLWDHKNRCWYDTMCQNVGHGNSKDCKEVNDYIKVLK